MKVVVIIALTLSSVYSDISRSPNKLLCYTRSSTLVHDLPAQFPSLATTKKILDTDKTTVANFIIEKTDKLMMHKLSILPSQTSVQQLLREFVSSEVAEVCVLLANMHETSCKTINHIRVMIEDAEVKANDQQSKLFVLLLHFSPSQFFQHCYPALFLKGWDHIYLDSVAQNTSNSVVVIHDWFLKCCFPAEELNTKDQDTLKNALIQLLPQAISVISSRVIFRDKGDGSFNSKMDATLCNDALQRLLFEKGLGDILCDKFCAYWKPKVMTEYLEKAATFSKQRESILNMTDFIQTQVTALFMEFCVYVLTKANESFNLDLLCNDETSSGSIQELFLRIVLAFPTSLSNMDYKLPALQPPVHNPQFPFFTHIYSLMEKQVELTRETAELQPDLLANPSLESVWVNVPSVSLPPKSLDYKLHTLVKAVVADLETQLNVSFGEPQCN